jgi:UDP-N-acetylmuramate dehydrogenase
VISKTQYEALQATHPDIPGYQVMNGMKVPAGWLIEKAGFKDYRLGGMATYEKHALVLINESATQYAALAAITAEITQKVKQSFGINLQQEPELIESHSQAL